MGQTTDGPGPNKRVRPKGRRRINSVARGKDRNRLVSVSLLAMTESVAKVSKRLSEMTSLIEEMRREEADERSKMEEEYVPEGGEERITDAPGDEGNDVENQGELINSTMELAHSEEEEGLLSTLTIGNAHYRMRRRQSREDEFMGLAHTADGDKVGRMRAQERNRQAQQRHRQAVGSCTAKGRNINQTMVLRGPQLDLPPSSLNAKNFFESSSARFIKSIGAPWFTLWKKPYSEQASLMISLALFLPYFEIHHLRSGRIHREGPAVHVSEWVKSRPPDWNGYGWGDWNCYGWGEFQVQERTKASGRAFEESIRIATKFPEMENTYSSLKSLRYEEIDAMTASEQELRRRLKALGALKIVTSYAVGRYLEDANSRNLEDLNSSDNNRRVKLPLFSAFCSDDAVNYFDIATVPVDRCVLDFEEDEDDSDPDDAESEEDDDEGDDGSIVGQDLDGEGTTCMAVIDVNEMMEGPGVEEKEESVWASSLSCLRYFVYDRGKIRRSRLKGLDIRVIKALVQISRRNSWAQIVHCKLNDYSADLDVLERLLIRCKYQFPSTGLEDKAEIKSGVLLWAKLLMAQAQIKGSGPRVGGG
ncbi:hypothetical protein F511_05147 [Dorcoceras hygrometricum]|uniref:Uncharacterized protein n=1 Tax=Dorcoceras hygrometricum TaxID=472368 RepID=A0A2Z7C248_9LAMI|nr:hypothetical protein F511_05147 [Dorcoceras hygrometricum]